MSSGLAMGLSKEGGYQIVFFCFSLLEMEALLKISTRIVVVGGISNRQRHFLVNVSNGRVDDVCSLDIFQP